jgi:hypothetical protein
LSDGAVTTYVAKLGAEAFGAAYKEADFDMVEEDEEN